MSLTDRLLSRLPVERFRHPPPLVPVIRLAGVIGQTDGACGTHLAVHALLCCGPGWGTAPSSAVFLAGAGAARG